MGDRNVCANPVTCSTQIGTQFLSLQPEINNLLTEVQGKRPEFDKAGFRILDVRSLIRDSVVIQKDKAGDLGGAVSQTSFVIQMSACLTLT